VTNNVPDFESLRRAHEAAGNKVPGLIYTSDLTFPQTKAYMSGSRRHSPTPRRA